MFDNYVYAQIKLEGGNVNLRRRMGLYEFKAIPHDPSPAYSALLELGKLLVGEDRMWCPVDPGPLMDQVLKAFKEAG